MENKKTNLVKAFVFVAIAVILTATGTYAFFRANIEGTESTSTISVGGATLAIKYEGSNLITAENVIPGWSAKKYFNVDVTNTSGRNISYDIKLVVENSNFYTTNASGNSYLEYALYECSSEADTTCETVIKSSSVLDIQSGDKLVYTATTKTSVKTYYALELSFPNQNTVQSQTGTNDQPLTFSGYVTIDTSDEVYYKPTFANADWATIASMVKTDPKVFAVGSEKEVAIDGKNYTVRVANNTTPSECSTPGFSQTACGFVVEFVDIIEKRAMNGANTNVGGWPATAMYQYLNGIKNADDTWDRSNTLYSKLPSDLRNAIKDTTVVSGHGSTSGETNFTSTDKLYLLSTKEVWSDGVSYDTATGLTRQLDYYAKNNVTTSNYSGVIKKNNAGSAAVWWLRAAGSNDGSYFFTVDSYGTWTRSAAGSSYGVAPAFRIE